MDARATDERTPGHPGRLPAGGAAVPPSDRWWEAVRVPSIIGICAVGVLGERSEPIIEGQALRTMTWLVPGGMAAGWGPAALGVQVLMRGPAIPAPPAGAPNGAESAWWLIPPTATYLADPDDLLDALEQVR